MDKLVVRWSESESLKPLSFETYEQMWARENVNSGEGKMGQRTEEKQQTARFSIVDFPLLVFLPLTVSTFCHFRLRDELPVSSLPYGIGCFLHC